jgi:hypothetical protein
LGRRNTTKIMRGKEEEEEQKNNNEKGITRGRKKTS